MNVQPYDFRKPTRRAGGLEERLAGWLRAAASLAVKRGSKHLPYRLDVGFREVEVVRGAEALARLPEQGIGYRVKLQAGAVTGLLVYPRPVLLALIAGMLGEISEALPEDRELSIVDESLAEYLLQDVVVAPLEEAWPGKESVRLTLSQKEPNPRFTRAFTADEMVVACSCLFLGPFGQHDWHWFLPRKELLEMLGQTEENQEMITKTDARSRLEVLVRDLPVEVSVSLGSVNLPLAQLGNLRPGDVIILNQRVTEQLTASVAGEKKFRGWPGRMGGQQAYQIESLIEG